MNENDERLTQEERDALMTLRDRGFAVAVFTPDELNGVEAKRVEERMIETGWDVISWLED